MFDQVIQANWDQALQNGRWRPDAMRFSTGATDVADPSMAWDYSGFFGLPGVQQANQIGDNSYRVTRWAGPDSYTGTINVNPDGTFADQNDWYLNNPTSDSDFFKGMVRDAAIAAGGAAGMGLLGGAGAAGAGAGAGEGFGFGSNVGALGEAAPMSLDALRAGELAGYESSGLAMSPAIAANGGGFLSSLGPVGNALGTIGSGVGSALGAVNGALKDYGPLVGLGANLGGALLSSNAIDKGVDAQQQSAAESNALLKYMYDTTRADNMPALNARNDALSGYQNLLKNPSSLTSDPGYQFGLSEGGKAIDRSAAARGNLYSGQTLKALNRYGQDYAGSKFDNALNRFGNLAGLGQVGSNTIANAGNSYATNAAGNITGAGNAAASGYVGSANAWNGAIGNSLNGWMQNDMMNRLLPRP